MGAVFLAHDPVGGRHVAVKLFGRFGGESEEVRQLFLKELRASGGLIHPNVAAIYDRGEINGQPFVTMEYVEGVTLESLCVPESSVPLGVRLSLIDQLCQGLHYGHKASLIHRDIKPGNLLVTPEWVLKIVDFGIARLANADVDHMTFAGSPGYMSPEQIHGKVVDARSDMFAVGVVAYQLLSSRRPFRGRTVAEIWQQTLTVEPPPLDQIVDVGPALAAVIHRALAKSPEQRLVDMDAMRIALREATASLSERVLQQPPAVKTAGAPSGTIAAAADSTVLAKDVARALPATTAAPTPAASISSPIQPAEERPRARSTVLGILGQNTAPTVFGLITSLITALLLAELDTRLHFALYAWTFWFVIPIGAIFSGAAASSGYYVGALVSQRRPTRLILVNILLVAIATYFVIAFLRYQFIEIKGVPLSRLIGFRSFLDLSITSQTISVQGTRLPSPAVGMFGYLLALLQILGFALGGFLVFGLLLARGYCRQCGRYLSSPIEVSGYGPIEADLMATYEQVRRFVAAGSTMSAVSLVRALPKEELHFQIRLSSARCATCAREYFDTAFLASRGRGWVTRVRHRVDGLKMTPEREAPAPCTTRRSR